MFDVSVIVFAVYVTVDPEPEDLAESPALAVSLNCGIWRWNEPRPWPDTNTGASVENQKVHVLLNPAAGAGYLADSTRTSFFTLVLLLAFFGIASVLFWAYFRFRPKKAAPESAPEHAG